MAASDQPEGMQVGGATSGGSTEVQASNTSFEETFATSWLNSREVTLGGAMGVLESRLSATLAPLHASIAQGTIHQELTYQGNATPNDLRARLAEVTDWSVAGGVAPRKSKDAMSRLQHESTKKHVDNYAGKCRREMERLDSEREELQAATAAIEEDDLETLPTSKHEELATLRAKLSLLDEAKERFQFSCIQNAKFRVAAALKAEIPYFLVIQAILGDSYVTSVINFLISVSCALCAFGPTKLQAIARAQNSDRKGKIVRTTLAGIEPITAVGANLGTALGIATTIVVRTTTVNTLISWISECTTKLANLKGWELVQFSFRSTSLRSALFMDSLSSLTLSNENIDAKRKEELTRSSMGVYRQQTKNPTLVYFGGLDRLMNLLRIPEGNFCLVMGALAANYSQQDNVETFRETFKVNSRVAELLLGCYKEACTYKDKSSADFDMSETSKIACEAMKVTLDELNKLRQGDELGQRKAFHLEQLRG